MKSDSDSVLIVAAEASSALYARRLLEHWAKQDLKIDFFGIGDQSMVDIGFRALGRAEEMAVVGLQEVLAHYSDIKKVFDSVLDEVDQKKPKFALLLDYPGFNLRLAKRLKARGIPVIYYISPQIWAWKQGRIKSMKRDVDLVLTLFPFENKFYQDHDVPVNFVGHPLLDEIRNMNLSEKARKDLRQKYGFDEGHFVVGLMPGSRKSELKHHLETQLAVARKLRKENGNVRIALLVAPGLETESVRNQVGDLRFPLVIVQAEPFQMIHMTDTILCASGTATLMVGLMKKPMVVMYKMNPFTAFMAKLLVKKTKFFAMVNLILDGEVVPERFQEDANVKELVEQLSKFIKDEGYRTQTESDLSQLQNQLGDHGATERVAQALEAYIR